eukprot:8786294-Prorocentrum_lima.AAC.1
MDGLMLSHRTHRMSMHNFPNKNATWVLRSLDHFAGSPRMAWLMLNNTAAVSYTHLTLPTSVDLGGR